MESSPYMESIVAVRSQRLSQEESTAGETTISAETQEDLTSAGIASYVEDRFPDFLRHLSRLNLQSQELLLSYYLLAKSQQNLSRIHKNTQTVTSFNLRMAVKVLCAYLLYEEFTVDTMRPVLEKAGLDANVELDPALLSTIVDAYGKVRNFTRVAELFDVHPPVVRRSMSNAVKIMVDSKDPHEQALAAYMFSLIDKANPLGSGVSKRQSRKEGHIVRADPAILGQFEINVEDPDFEECFCSRANF